jgi:hypothetical protein
VKDSITDISGEGLHEILSGFFIGENENEDMKVFYTVLREVGKKKPIR